jgi:predicted transcriptional regulator
MKSIDVHVGYEPAASKARVLRAIRQAEVGPVEPESHVTFESWKGLSRVLTGKRLDLLRHVRRTPAASVAELARALGRDYKRVHEDVEILATAGLLDRTETGAVQSAYDEIRTVIDLTQAA